jgi:hypothetical protein
VLLEGVRAVPGLTALGSSAVPVMVTVPSDTPPGSYYLVACADDLTVVPETNEGDNCRASTGRVVVQHANLAVTALSNPPAAAGLGGRFSVTDTTKNQAPVPAGASTTRYFLSLDQVRSGDDVLLEGVRAVPGLTALGSSAVPVMVTVPGATPLGSYYLVACADDLAAVVETNEGDNCRASTGRVVVQHANLAVTALSNPPAAAGLGGQFRVTETTKNQAPVPAGASTTRYYLSLDQVRSGDDVLLEGVRAVLGLTALGSSAVPVMVTVPSDTPPGSYYLVACADDLTVVPETNEGDNCRTSTGRVTVQPASLALTTPTNGPAAGR